MTPAHTQTKSLTLLQVFPEHEPRTGDPHYHVFNETRARLKALGKLVCWINNGDCDHTHPVELHHNMVEFSIANIVDEAQFEQLYPDFKLTSDEDFLNWVEREGNLLPLCKMHHTGVLGIHNLDYPLWLPQRFMKAGVDAPERVVAGAAPVSVTPVVTP